MTDKFDPRVPDLIMVPDPTYTGPGVRYNTNALDVLRAVTHPDVGIDYLLGPKKGD